MSDLVLAYGAADWRRLKALVLNSVSPRNTTERPPVASWRAPGKSGGMTAEAINLMNLGYSLSAALPTMQTALSAAQDRPSNN